MNITLESNASTETAVPLIFTESAANKVRQLIEVKLLVDFVSFQYLAGAEIDYQENLEGSQFIIKNPSAASTCGCGSSFSA